MGELKKWVDQNWVRIGTDGSIKGKCGTSKDKKNPDRCLPIPKAKVKLKNGGEVRRIARGCGKVMSNRRKKTKYS